MFICKQTRLFVTNSLSFLPQADEIWMLDEGVIQESGSYEELKNRNGMFANFIKNFLLSSEANREKNGIIKDRSKLSKF